MRRLTLMIPILLLAACTTEPSAPVVAGAELTAARSGRPPVATGSFDIYIYDALSGVATQLTTLGEDEGENESNPSWSNSGQKIVHDVGYLDGSLAWQQSLYITDVTTGVSRPLVGGDGGNDADWSPTGQFIAFDRIPVGDNSVYFVPAGGGTPTLVRANAFDASWSPGDRLLAVVDLSDFSIRTIDPATGREHLVAAYGFNPTFSRDGRRIAYTDGSNIFTVAVDQRGASTGVPVQLTADGPGMNGQPSWSNDHKSIVFHSGRGATGDWDLWVVPLTGSEPTLLYGLPGEGEFDPAFFGKSRVAFSRFTP